MLVRPVMCILLLVLSSFSLMGKAIYYEVESKGTFLEKERMEKMNEEEVLVYCVPSSTTPWNDYITGVTLGSINNANQSSAQSATPPPQGFGDYTNLSTDLTIGQMEPFTAETTFKWYGGIGTSCPAYFYVWIDLNGDDDFSDSGELIVAEQLVIPHLGSTPTINENIVIPSSASTRITRMRIVLKNTFSQDPADNIPPTPCESGFLGEVEDYTVNLIGGTTDTTPPTPTLSGPTSTTGNYDVNVVFDEVVTSVPEISDFLLINGTVNNINDLGTGTDFTANITPTSSGNVSIALTANAVQDPAGNGNVESNIHVCNYTATSPTTNPTLTLIPSNETVPGANDGAIDAMASDGTPPYTYDWDHLPGTNNPEDLSNLASGTYTLTVTDDNGITVSASTTLSTQSPTGNQVDLSVTMIVDDYSAGAYVNRAYTIKVRNDKIGTASDVKLLIPIDGASFVVIGGSSPVATSGTYDQNTGVWDVGSVNFGTTETLQLFLFTFTSEPTLYAQVNEMSAGDLDIDSTPGNGVSPNVVEDDEAEVTLGVGPVFPSNSARFVKLKKKLDAGYTAVTDYVLRFTYEEDYHVENVIDDVLEYQIYNINYEPVNNMSGILPNKYGVNWQELDLNGIGSLPGQAAFYVLEVKNLNKEESYFLRFKYVTE